MEASEAAQGEHPALGDCFGQSGKDINMARWPQDLAVAKARCKSGDVVRLEDMASFERSMGPRA